MDRKCTLNISVARSVVVSSKEAIAVTTKAVYTVWTAIISFCAMSVLLATNQFWVDPSQHLEECGIQSISSVLFVMNPLLEAISTKGMENHIVTRTSHSYLVTLVPSVGVLWFRMPATFWTKCIT